MGPNAAFGRGSRCSEAPAPRPPANHDRIVYFVSHGQIVVGAYYDKDEAWRKQQEPGRSTKIDAKVVDIKEARDAALKKLTMQDRLVLGLD